MEGGFVTRFFFLIKMGLKNIVRHRRTSWPLVLSLFILISINLGILLARGNINLALNLFTSHARIEVILEKGLSSEAVSQLISSLKEESLTEIRSMTYRDETENLNAFASQDETLAEAVALLGENPLPPTLTIQCVMAMESLPHISSFAQNLKKKEGVSEVIYPGGWFARLYQMARGADVFFLILLGALFLVTFILWVSIFKATLYPLRDEIEIMEIVGGTKLYIRTPFYLESFFYALLSLAGALALLRFLFDSLRDYFPDLRFLTTEELLPAGVLIILLALLGTEKAINRFFK